MYYSADAALWNVNRSDGHGRTATVRSTSRRNSDNRHRIRLDRVTTAGHCVHLTKLASHGHSVDQCTATERRRTVDQSDGYWGGISKHLRAAAWCPKGRRGVGRKQRDPSPAAKGAWESTVTSPGGVGGGSPADQRFSYILSAWLSLLHYRIIFARSSAWKRGGLSPFYEWGIDPSTPPPVSTRIYYNGARMIIRDVRLYSFKRVHDNCRVNVYKIKR